MIAIDLESVDTSGTKAETVSPETPVIDTTPEKSTPETSEKMPTKETVKPKEIEPFMKVGEKPYTKEQVIETLEKVGRYQGDRDRTEAAIEKVLRQMQQAGYTVDQNLNVIPLQRPVQPNKQELAMLAAAGDNEALSKLLEIHGEEVANKVYGNVQRIESNRSVLEKVHKDFPDFYGSDGQPNLDSPLSKETAKILEENPQFGDIKYLPLIAEMAQSRLLKGNFKNLEQSIKDKTHQKLAQSASQSLESPGSRQEDTSSGYTEEQLNFAKKIGVDSDRLSKIIKRANEDKKGGYVIS